MYYPYRLTDFMFQTIQKNNLLILENTINHPYTVVTEVILHICTSVYLQGELNKLSKHKKEALISTGKSKVTFYYLCRRMKFKNKINIKKSIILHCVCRIRKYEKLLYNILVCYSKSKYYFSICLDCC